MNPVVHFEMPYEDKERMIGFYEKAFGWVPERMGPEMGEYVVVRTSETDEKGMLKEPGRINGGLYKKPADPNGGYPSIVVAVPDIRAAMQRVTEAGGELAGSGPDKSMEPAEIPGVGLFMSIKDSEGNRISMIQPAERM